MLVWIFGTGVALIVVAVVAHFAFPGKAIKVPAIVLATIGGLAAGSVLGMLGAVMYGESVHTQIYGDLYKPEPMPTRGGPRPLPQNGQPGQPNATPPSPPPSADVPPDAPARSGLSADHPGLADGQKAPAAAERPAPN